MSAPYSQHSTHFHSALTKRDYHFTPDPSRSNQRRALAQLQSDDQVIMDANDARAMATLGRRLSLREHMNGNWSLDTRTEREKIAAESVIHSQPETNSEANPFTGRIAELRSRPTYMSSERAAIQRRIEQTQKDSEKWEAERAAIREHEERMNSNKVADAIVDAQTWMTRLRTNPEVPQKWVDDAMKRLTELESNGDTDSYWQATLAFEAERELILNTRADQFDSQAKELKADAQALRRGEPIELVNVDETNG